MNEEFKQPEKKAETKFSELIGKEKALKAKDFLLKEAELGMLKVEKTKNRVIENAEKKVTLDELRNIALNQRAEIKNAAQKTDDTENETYDNSSELSLSQIVEKQINLMQDKEKEISEMFKLFDTTDDKAKIKEIKNKIESRLIFKIRNNFGYKDAYVRMVTGALVDASKTYGALSDKTNEIHMILETIEDLQPEL